MSDVTERDFGNFYLADDPYKLAGGLLPDIARELGIDIGVEPTVEGMQSLMGKVGRNKVLRENEEVTAITSDEAAVFVARSGIMRQTDRSLHDPNITTGSAHVNTAIMMGAVANWGDRTTQLLQGRAPGRAERVRVLFTHKQLGLRIFALAGNREMKSATEVVNPGVAHIKEVFGRNPTEAEHVNGVLVPKLVRARHNVLPMTYTTTDGDTMLREFFSRNVHLLDGEEPFKFMVARVAGSSIPLAFQAQAAARTVKPDFDTDPSNPQVFALSSKFPLARTPEQVQDSVHYQKPETALRQVVLHGLKILEAQQA